MERRLACGAIMIRDTTGALLLAAAVAASALTQATTDGRAASVYDGPWSVVVVTRTGPCDASYRFSGEIVNGDIFYAYGSLEVTGHVAASGATFVRVTRGSAHGEAHGKLTATQGSGTWSGQGPDGHCAGTWIATRASAK
jgi:hypothetical protein